MREREGLFARVKARVNIVDVVDAELEQGLTSGGSPRMGLCPFHQEKTPSFAVYENSQRYHCFSCRVKGDVIEFVQQIRKLTKMEAVKVIENYGADGAASSPATTTVRVPEPLISEPRRVAVLTAATEFYVRQLGASQLAYLTSRGLSESTVKRFRLGYASGAGLREYLSSKGFLDAEIVAARLLREGSLEEAFKDRIVVPFLKGEQTVYFVGRTLLEVTDKNPAYWNLPGNIPRFFNEDGLADFLDESDVWLVEGVFDCMAMAQRELICVGLVGNTLKEKWIGRIPTEAAIKLLLDNDEGGRGGAQRAVEMLLRANRHGAVVHLPDDIDPDEYVLKNTAKGLGNLPMTPFGSVVAPPAEVAGSGPDDDEGESAPPSWDKERMAALHKTVESNFRGLWEVVEACLSVVVQLRIDGASQPLALILEGRPSGLKTTALSFFYDFDSIFYHTDNFSPKAFVTHAANVRREQLEEIDLLPRLKGKVLLTPELAPLFQADEKELHSTFGTLTRVLDGQGLWTDSGVHGGRGYRGDYMFCWLGATTPIPAKVFRVFGNLGARLYFFAVPDRNLTSRQLYDQLFDDEPYKAKVAECREPIQSFLRELWERPRVKWDSAKESEENKMRIAQCAELLAHLRGKVEMYKENDGLSLGRYNWTEPLFEDPIRAASLLYNLARGRALLYGRNSIAAEDLLLVRSVAVSSAPRERRTLLDLLLRHQGWVDNEVVERELGCGTSTAHRNMELLKVLKLAMEVKCHIGKRKVIFLARKYWWLLNESEESIGGRLRSLGRELEEAYVAEGQADRKESPFPDGETL